MATDIVFFLAPDDETAARTRLKGPGPALTSVACHDFTVFCRGSPGLQPREESAPERLGVKRPDLAA
ncbi:hypothetical protein ABZZ36_42405, partial [Actinacidiphila glaucinigra]|uniref:hypothetical protein n=1 Tax=Actinacidiphila glaucinigra TaxID=235986 RepID=UPI0033B02076